MAVVLFPSLMTVFLHSIARVYVVCLYFLNWKVEITWTLWVCWEKHPIEQTLFLFGVANCINKRLGVAFVLWPGWIVVMLLVCFWQGQRTPTATCSWRRGVFLHVEHLHPTVPSSDPCDPIMALVCYHHGLQLCRVCRTVYLVFYCWIYIYIYEFYMILRCYY